MLLSNRIHHFAVAVSDLDASVSWYCDKLDFSIHKQFEIPEDDIEIVKLISETGVRLELLKRAGKESNPAQETDLVAPGTKHLCFEVDNMDEAVEEIRRRGIRLAQEPKIFEASREKNCWITDHEGNPIEFIEELGEKGRRTVRHDP